MRNNSLATINKLVDNLPESDIAVAKKLIKDRDFESLEWHVMSAIRKIEKNPDILHDNSDKLTSLRKLYSEVVSYKEMLNIIFNDDDDVEEAFPEYFDPDSFSEEDIW